MERILIVFALSLAAFLLLAQARSWAVMRYVIAMMSTGGATKYQVLATSCNIGMLCAGITWVVAFGKLVLLLLG